MTTDTPARWTEYMPLADLRPNPANPKGHDTDLIDASVGRFGYIEPITLDERTGYLISGHGRRETMLAMHERGESVPEGVQVSDDGAWLVPVARGWSSRTDTEASAALIALNRTTEAGGWEDAALLDLLDQVSALGDEAFVGVGFNERDLDDLRALSERLDAEGGTRDLDELAAEYGADDPEKKEADALRRVVLILPPDLADRLEAVLVKKNHAEVVTQWLSE